MRLAVEVGSVADGTLRGALQYCKDRQIERVAIPFAALEGYSQAGSLDLDILRGVMSQIDDAGLSASTMVCWAPPEIWAGVSIAMSTTEPGQESGCDGRCRC